jgi:acyl carrier protein
MASDHRPSLETPDVEGRILAFLQRELLSRDVSVGPDDALLEGGLLDSMAVLRLATFVEGDFRFKMQPSDFVIENFQTVAVLAAFVCERTNDTGAIP